MNEIIKALYERKSMRVYENRPIQDNMKDMILEAADVYKRQVHMQLQL